MMNVRRRIGRRRRIIKRGNGRRINIHTVWFCFDRHGWVSNDRLNRSFWCGAWPLSFLELRQVWISHKTFLTVKRIWVRTWRGYKCDTTIPTLVIDIKWDWNVILGAEIYVLEVHLRLLKEKRTHDNYRRYILEFDKINQTKENTI